MSYDVILLIAGSGERCGLGYNKVLYKINGQPLFLYSLKKFLEFDECHKIILVLQEAEKDEIFQYIGKEYLEKVDFVYGGNIRQQSVLNGLEKVTEKYVLGSIWWKIVYGLDVEAMKVYVLLTSLPKNTLYLLPQSILLFIVLKALAKPLAKFGLLHDKIAENVELF